MPHQIFCERTQTDKKMFKKLIIIKMKFTAHLSRKLKEELNIFYLIWFENSLSGFLLSFDHRKNYLTFCFHSTGQQFFDFGSFLRISDFTTVKKSSNCCCWWFRSMSWCGKWFVALVSIFAVQSITFYDFSVSWGARKIIK